MGILDKLAEQNIIDESQVPEIQQEAEKKETSVEEVLRSRGITEDQIIEGKGASLNVPVRHITDEHIPREVLDYIPEESATHYEFVPIGMEEGVLEVGMIDPDNISARDALNFISSKANVPFKIYLISRDDFNKVLEMYKGLSSEVTEALSELETELGSVSEEDAKSVEKPKEEDVDKEAVDTKIIEDAPVTKIVATVLRYATEGNASDVHVEPLRESVRVRFRVDGVLNTSLMLPKKVHLPVVARIKILCNMRLDEKRKPQDGRFSAKIEGRKIDFRVSTFPTYYGEKIVMRILDHEKGVRSLEEIGLSENNLDIIRKSIKRPYGIILISGPTGSGKTTTLYSMLQELDREKKNILSLEDPIEYNIEGISQSQVFPDIGYTFANGLRTTLRQDPDIIMVGEIRDKETAQLAIQAALTGHLVLSTIHTNNAIGVIPRLVDMGIDPYLIAPTLILAIAQRLVSQLCPDAGKEKKVEGSIKMMIDKQFEDLPEEYKKKVPFKDIIYEAGSSKSCPDGTKGRTAVMETLEVDKEMERIILSDPTENAIYKQARGKGMLTMKEDAIVKAFNKEIPFEAVNSL